MFCPNCGQNNLDEAQFCTSCGTALNQQSAPQQQAPQQPVYQQPVYQQPAANAVPVKPKQPANGLAVASLVLGLVSFFCFAVITGGLAIIFGAVAKSKGNTGGMATGGIACGVVGVALWLVMLIACQGTMGLMTGLGL